MIEIEFEYYEKGTDVLVILTGMSGTTKGYENKYERIANQVTKDYGFSVVIATTPPNSLMTSKDNLQCIMDMLIQKANGNEFKVYAMGSSAGGNLLLSFSYLFPQIKRVLAINPVINLNFHLIDKGIKSFIGEKLSVVLGELDSASKWVELLPKTDNSETTILPNIDHVFRGYLETFIELPKQYLFFSCK